MLTLFQSSRPGSPPIRIINLPSTGGAAGLMEATSKDRGVAADWPRAEQAVARARPAARIARIIVLISFAFSRSTPAHTPTYYYDDVPAKAFGPIAGDVRVRTG